MTPTDAAAGAVALSVPPAPRLRLEPTGSGRTLLDGGWWPRSVDPAAELPGLILAIDTLHGPVIRLALHAAGWEPHPRRLEVAGRARRLGYFTSQPAALLTARCDNGHRVDLLIVPPDTARGSAEAAMALAATAGNLIAAPGLLAQAREASAAGTDGVAEQVWDSEGGRFAGTDSAPTSAPRPAGHAARRPTTPNRR